MMLCLLLFTTGRSAAQESLDGLYKVIAQGFKTGRYDDALIAGIKALKIAEKEKDCPQMAYAYLQIGKMQYYNKDNRQALNYFFKSLHIIDSCGVDSLRHTAYHNIGSMYTELSQTDSALSYLARSKKILEGTDKYANLSKVNAVMAELYMLKLNDYKAAETYVAQAEKYAALSKDKKWIAFALMKRGLLQSRQGNYAGALFAFKAALKAYEEMDHVEGKLYAMRYILEALSSTGSPDTKNYLSTYITLKDSVFKAEGAAKIAEYKTLYETEKKETENKLLQQQNRLNQAEISSKNKTIISLLIGVSLIIIILFWRISVMNLKKKNRELEAARELQKEKERISRDLHDNVGGQLSYVLYSLGGLEASDRQTRAELITNINTSVRNVIGSLRETIWAMSDASLTLNDLSDKLKVYARGMFGTTDTKILFSEQMETDKSLSALTGLNLYRICQEIITNTFKHAQASELVVDIRKGETTVITISDNGKGFDPGVERPESYGLSNIQARAQEVGIRLSLTTAPGKGVTYTLII